MTTTLSIVLSLDDWCTLFLKYLTLSLMSIGGAISTTAEMHRFLVEQHQWLTQPQFNASIALAQAAPGPNVLFVALMGWQVGLNAGSIAAALAGVTVTMIGIMLPSATITYLAAQWGHRNRNKLSVRAFKQGMVPVVIALLLSTGWLLAGADLPVANNWRLWMLSAFCAIVIWRTKLHLLWLLGLGAVLGWFHLL